MNSRIPKFIHQIWLGPQKPDEEMQKWMKSWREHYPAWEYILWDEKKLASLTAIVPRRSVATPLLAQKVDLLRFIILHEFGGLYVDADFESYKNLEPLFSANFVYGDELEGTPAIGLLMSVPQHPICRIMTKRQLDSWPWNGHAAISWETGPNAFRQSLLEYFGNEPVMEKQCFEGVHVGNRICDTLALLPRTIYPYYYGQTLTKPNRDQAFAAHHWRASWTSKDKSHVWRPARFRVNTDDEKWIIPELIDRDMYRMADLVCVANCFPGPAIDGGAHIGVFTGLLKSHGFQEKVYAFEPVSENRNIASSNLKEWIDCEGVILLDSALADEQGQMQIASPKDQSHTGCWSVLGASSRQETVPTVNLFRIIAEQPVSLLKLDLEGYEAVLLNAMPDYLFRNVGVLVIEQHSLPICWERLAKTHKLWFKPFEMDGHRVYVRRD